MKSSNYREMFADLMRVLSFKEKLKNKQVQILSDKVTTVAIINSTGGASIQLDAITRSIQLEAIEANIGLTAKYLSGMMN